MKQSFFAFDTSNWYCMEYGYPIPILEPFELCSDRDQEREEHKEEMRHYEQRLDDMKSDMKRDKDRTNKKTNKEVAEVCVIVIIDPS